MTRSVTKTQTEKLPYHEVLWLEIRLDLNNIQNARKNMQNALKTLKINLK